MGTGNDTVRETQMGTGLASFYGTDLLGVGIVGTVFQITIRLRL